MSYIRVAHILFIPVVIDFPRVAYDFAIYILCEISFCAGADLGIVKTSVIVFIRFSQVFFRYVLFFQVFGKSALKRVAELSVSVFFIGEYVMIPLGRMPRREKHAYDSFGKRLALHFVQKFVQIYYGFFSPLRRRQTILMSVIAAKIFGQILYGRLFSRIQSKTLARVVFDPLVRRIHAYSQKYISVGNGFEHGIGLLYKKIVRAFSRPFDIARQKISFYPALPERFEILAINVNVFVFVRTRPYVYHHRRHGLTVQHYRRRSVIFSYFDFSIRHFNSSFVYNLLAVGLNNQKLY